MGRLLAAYCTGTYNLLRSVTVLRQVRQMEKDTETSMRTTYVTQKAKDPPRCPLEDAAGRTSILLRFSG
jgi:hypothetical protein